MGKCVTGCGRPQAASMPHRTEMGIHAHFPLGVGIMLRNRRRKRARKTGPDVPFFFSFTQHERDFFAGRRQRERLSRIFRARFRRKFLSRMRKRKGNRARMHGLARCGKDAA